MLWFEIRFWSWAAWFVFTRFCAGCSVGFGVTSLYLLVSDAVHPGPNPPSAGTAAFIAAMAVAAAVSGAVTVVRAPAAPNGGSDD